MESFLNKALMPLFLIACLAYVFYELDADTPEPVAEPVTFGPVVVRYPESTALATRRDEEPPLSFGEYPCSDDCSEHIAGYDWGEDNGIFDPDNCDGRSAQFIEGCRVYAEGRGVDVAMTN